MCSCEFPQDSVFGNAFPFILPQYYSNFECTHCLITRFVLQIQNGPSDCKVHILSQNSIDPEVIRTCSVDPLPREIFFLKIVQRISCGQGQILRVATFPKDRNLRNISTKSGSYDFWILIF